MPVGQVCGHCEQPRHNKRTCAAYAKYLEQVAEVQRLRDELEEINRKLAEAYAAASEDRAIIRWLTKNKQDSQRRIADLEKEVERLRLRMAMALPGD